MTRPLITSAGGMPITAAKVVASALPSGADAAWMITSHSMLTEALSTQTTAVCQGLTNLEAKMDFVMSLMETVMVTQGLTDEKGLSLLYEKQWMPNGCTPFQAQGKAKTELTSVDVSTASDSETNGSSRVSTSMCDDEATSGSLATPCTHRSLSSREENGERRLTKTRTVKKDTKKPKCKKEDAGGNDYGRSLQGRVDQLEKLLMESTSNTKKELVPFGKSRAIDEEAMQRQYKEHLQCRVDYLEQLSEELLGDSADLHAQWERMTGRDEQVHELKERVQYLEAFIDDVSVSDYGETAGGCPFESLQHEEVERVD